MFSNIIIQQSLSAIMNAKVDFKCKNDGYIMECVYMSISPHT